jgi:putative endonuclease
VQRREVGRLGEGLAALHLERGGWQVCERNWRCRYGEIDLICRDGATVVFVEVRTLRTSRTGRPEASIDLSKRNTVVRASLVWLQRNGGSEQPIRYDVVAVELAGPAHSIRHIRGAFDATGEVL